MPLVHRYNNVLRRLYNANKQFKVVMQLERVEALHAMVGKPLDKFQTIHVAGTNGKGSTCWKTASALQFEGYNVGLFTSPHIASYRERFRINGKIVEQEVVVEIMEELFHLTDSKNITASFFEYTTMFGLMYFARCGVDFVILETGCGGRLDATNIVTKPALTCITSIGLDHVAILGSTIEEITAHKAGIMKADVPCVAGPKVRNDLLHSHADIVGTSFYSYEDLAKQTKIDAEGYQDATTVHNHKNFELENSELVRRMLRFANQQGIIKISDRAIEYGAIQRPPYRLERVKVPLDFGRQTYENHPVNGGESIDVVFDCAHNVDAFEALFSTYASVMTPSSPNSTKHKLTSRTDNRWPRIILGFSNEKDVQTCLRRVLQHVPVRFVVIVFSFSFVMSFLTMFVYYCFLWICMVLQASQVHFIASKHRRAIAAAELLQILRKELSITGKHNELQEDLVLLDIDDKACFQKVFRLARAGMMSCMSLFVRSQIFMYNMYTCIYI